MFHQLQETVLFEELERRAAAKRSAAIKYRGQIESSCEHIASYLSEIRRYFHHYTDHCISHSIRILDRIGRLLRKSQLRKLSDIELFLLISSAMVHDIGMVVAEEEIHALLEDEDFKQERLAILEHFEIPECGDWTFGGVERLIVAEYVRRRHGRRCVFRLKSDLLPCVLLTGGDATVAKWLGVICEGHTLPFDNITKIDQYPIDVEVGRQQANIRFISICLRIGDLLDIDFKRASPFLRELSEPLAALSRAHWEQYQDVEVSGLAPGRIITIGGTSPSQDAERVLREWVSWLEEECARALPLLHLCNEKYHLRIGRIEYDVKPQEDETGRPFYEFHEYRFNLDEEQIFKRLFGHRLYGRSDVAFRELIQNAVDATRVRIALEVSEADDWDQLTDEEQWNRFHARYASRSSDLHVTLHLHNDTDEATGKDRTWLTITDQGVGMARDVIERYLLKVGRSRWKEDTRLSRLPIGTVGEFGVGFLSTFMISDRTIIETQSCLPNEEGIRVSIYGWKGYLATEPIAPRAPGTSIALLLKQDVADALNDLVDVVTYWCPFLELPIRIRSFDGKAMLIAPRHKGKMPQRDPHLCVHLHNRPSLALIERSSYPRTEEIAPSLCQDGMVVPEIPPPVIEEPQQQILRWRGIRVDLRGADRVPLDLSRNLTEERADALWKRLTPQIWAGIATNGLSFREGKSALGELLHSLCVTSRGRRVVAIGPKKRFVMGDLSAIRLPENIQWAELEDEHVQKAADSKSFATVLLPDIAKLIDPNILLHGKVVDEGQQWEWEYSYVHDHESDEEEDESGEDQLWKSTEEWVAEQKEIDIPEMSPFRNQDALDYWAQAFKGELFPSRTATLPLIRLFDGYRHAREGDNGFSALSANNGTPLASLGALWLSERWLAIRDPVRGNWSLLRTDEIDVILARGKKERLSFGEYVLLMLYQIRSPQEDGWGKGWPNRDQTTSLGTKMGELLSAYWKKQETGSSDYDEDEQGEYDEEPMTDDEAKELYFEKSYSEFTEVVLPNVDATILEKALLPWDIERWNRSRRRLLLRKRKRVQK